MSLENIALLLSNAQAEMTVCSAQLMGAGGEAAVAGMTLSQILTQRYDPSGDISTMLRTVTDIKNEIDKIKKRAEAVTAALIEHRGEAGG